MRMLADPEKVGQEIQSEGSHPLGVGCPCTSMETWPLGPSLAPLPCFGGGDPRITAEMGRSWSVCVPVRLRVSRRCPWVVSGRSEGQLSTLVVI